MKKRILVCLAALLLLLACLAGCGSGNSRTVGTCAGYDVAFEELRYVALSVQDLLKEQYGEDAWKDHRAELEAEVSARIAKDYNVLAAAAHYLPDRRPDDKDLSKQVDAAVSEAIEALGGKTLPHPPAVSIVRTCHRITPTITGPKRRIRAVRSERKP